MNGRPDTTPPIEDLGRVAFDDAHRRMLALVDSIRRDDATGKILIAEHDAVFTAGRRTPPEEIVNGIVPIERGGRITYHGPGQLIVYPIVRLPRRDVRHWLKSLERFGVAVCAAFGLEGTPSVDGTGVFVGARKVASIGVAIRHWINFHGISINIAMDLTPFHRIRPCGLDPTVMSDLTREVGHDVSMDEARAAARAAIPILFESE